MERWNQEEVGATADNRQTISDQPLLEGVLLKGSGGFYTVEDDGGQPYTLRCKKKFRRMKLSPCPGDRVMFSPGQGEEHGWIEEILPRKTFCIRPPVANVTQMMIVVAVVPVPDLMLVDRLMYTAHRQGMRCLLGVNKSDLDDGRLAETLREQYRGSGAAVYPLSAETGMGLDALRAAMGGEVNCMAGQSGVGKSTLLNKLFHLEQETGSISEKISRGKNTTRLAELIRRNGFQFMDTAGFSLLDMGEVMDPVMLKEDYPEFLPYEGRCRFSPCYHDGEPGCAVLQGVEDGEISPQRHQRYRQMLQEMREAWRNRYD